MCTRIIVTENRLWNFFVFRNHFRSHCYFISKIDATPPEKSAVDAKMRNNI